MNIIENDRKEKEINGKAWTGTKGKERKQNFVPLIRREHALNIESNNSYAKWFYNSGLV